MHVQRYSLVYELGLDAVRVCTRAAACDVALAGVRSLLHLIMTSKTSARRYRTIIAAVEGRPSSMIITLLRLL